MAAYIGAKSAGEYFHGHKAHYRCDCGAFFFEVQGEEVSWNEIVIRSTTGFDKQTFTKDYYTLNYCLYEPENLDKSKDKVPLVLFLLKSSLLWLHLYSKVIFVHSSPRTSVYFLFHVFSWKCSLLKEASDNFQTYST